MDLPGGVFLDSENENERDYFLANRFETLYCLYIDRKLITHKLLGGAIMNRIKIWINIIFPWVCDLASIAIEAENARDNMHNLNMSKEPK